MKKIRNICAALAGLFAALGPVVCAITLYLEYLNPNNWKWQHGFVEDFLMFYPTNMPVLWLGSLWCIAIVWAILAITCHIRYKIEEKENQV